MDDLHEANEETTEEPLPSSRNNSRRQRQQLRFAEEEKEKPPSSFKPPGRASRFLSICEPSLELPGANLLRLRQLHSQNTNDKNFSRSEEITDEFLDKIPFKIEIIPERRDDLDIVESRQKRQTTVEIPTVIPSSLTEQRRLQIIEEILKNLSQINILDEIRRTNAIPYRLPKNNQMEKNVAKRIEELTGSETIMLNDHIYMKNLCQRLEEKSQKELERNFERLASKEKRRQLSANTSI